MGCMNCTGTHVCVAQHIFVLSKAFAPELAHVQLYCVTTRCAKTGGDIAVNAASWTLCAPEICSVMRFGCACSMRAALLGMEKTRHMERHTWCRMRLRKYSMYRLCIATCSLGHNRGPWTKPCPSFSLWAPTARKCTWPWPGVPCNAAAESTCDAYRCGLASFRCP